MPKIPVDEYRDFLSHENDVRTSDDFPVMDPVPVSLRIYLGRKRLPEHDLDLRVLAAYPRHYLAPFLPGEDVGHTSDGSLFLLREFPQGCTKFPDDADDERVAHDECAPDIGSLATVRHESRMVVGEHVQPLQLYQHKSAQPRRLRPDDMFETRGGTSTLPGHDGP